MAGAKGAEGGGERVGRGECVEVIVDLAEERLVCYRLSSLSFDTFLNSGESDGDSWYEMLRIRVLSHSPSPSLGIQTNRRTGVLSDRVGRCRDVVKVRLELASRRRRIPRHLDRFDSTLDTRFVWIRRGIRVA